MEVKVFLGVVSGEKFEFVCAIQDKKSSEITRYNIYIVQGACRTEVGEFIPLMNEIFGKGK